MNVMIIDDNKLHLKMCSLLLGKMGHTVTTVASMAELKSASSGMAEPEVALVDYRLAPGVTGIDVINYMKNTNKWIKVKCIALTADVGEQSSLHDAGFDDIIYKPVTQAQLAETLRRYE